MLKSFAIVAAGVALGFGSAATAITQWVGATSVQVGPWQSPIDAGGPGRGMYLRAAAAITATLALSRQEALYFRASTDSQGRTLRGTCTYRVHGPDLPARWWSVTVYGADHYLIANPEGRYAAASVNTRHTPDGGISITVSPARHAGDWLDSAGAGNIVLLARLYEPLAASAAAPGKIALPGIDLQGCP